LNKRPKTSQKDRTKKRKPLGIQLNGGFNSAQNKHHHKSKKKSSIA